MSCIDLCLRSCSVSFFFSSFRVRSLGYDIAPGSRPTFLYYSFLFPPFSVVFVKQCLINTVSFFGKDDRWLAGARECLLLVPHLTLGSVFILPFFFFFVYFVGFMYCWSCVLCVVLLLVEVNGCIDSFGFDRVAICVMIHMKFSYFS